MASERNPPLRGRCAVNATATDGRSRLAAARRVAPDPVPLDSATVSLFAMRSSTGSRRLRPGSSGGGCGRAFRIAESRGTQHSRHGFCFRPGGALPGSRPHRAARRGRGSAPIAGDVPRAGLLRRRGQQSRRDGQEDVTPRSRRPAHFCWSSVADGDGVQLACSTKRRLGWMLTWPMSRARGPQPRLVPWAGGCAAYATARGSAMCSGSAGRSLEANVRERGR